MKKTLAIFIALLSAIALALPSIAAPEEVGLYAPYADFQELMES